MDQRMSATWVCVILEWNWIGMSANWLSADRKHESSQ